jgi:hypothetical protein
MGLEELFWLAVRVLGPSALRSALSALVGDAHDGELGPSTSCRRPSDAFDCDELGIYTDEDD